MPCANSARVAPQRSHLSCGEVDRPLMHVDIKAAALRQHAAVEAHLLRVATRAPRFRTHSPVFSPADGTLHQPPNFFLAVDNDADRNEWVAAIGRATTENRRVRSYSEEVEYQEQQARLAAARAAGD